MIACRFSSRYLYSQSASPASRLRAERHDPVIAAGRPGAIVSPVLLVRTLARDRDKDMASDYERADPTQDYAERRGITFRERVTEIVRKIVPEKVRNMFDGLRSPEVPGPEGGRGPEPGT